MQAPLESQPAPRDRIDEDENHLQFNRSCCDSSLETKTTRSIPDEYPAVDVV
jgi:hypothetical protein